ncbi:MAG TPA: helix-turn-helix transcriptional regulator [Candidatus Babeliaceae bacterium]|nr:helix-turn-helix transcriptional regulator [Candidatus Babeliaceae bacterium]
MSSSRNDKEIYSKLRELRRARGLTVNTLAEKIGENYQKVGRIERGARNLTLDYILKVSKALDTPVEAFFSESSEKIKNETPSPDLLNKIILFVEEYQTDADLDTKQKAQLISKIYQLTLKFPPTYQMLFLTSLFEILKKE